MLLLIIERLFMNKTWKIVLNVIIWLFVAFALIVTIISLSASLGSQDGVPSVFGKSMMSVQSDSMKPTFSQGDMIIAEKPEDPVEFEYSMYVEVTADIIYIELDTIRVE